MQPRTVRDIQNATTRPNFAHYDTYGSPEPRPLHIALYLDRGTKKHMLDYLWDTGLTGPLHESTAVGDMHVTLLYNGSMILPPGYPKSQKMDSQITLATGSYKVKPLALNMAMDGTSIAILLPSDLLLRKSNKLHAKFGLAPNPSYYIFHLTISTIQMKRPGSRAYEKAKFKTFADYGRLPDVNFPISFATEEVSYKS